MRLKQLLFFTFLLALSVSAASAQEEAAEGEDGNFPKTAAVVAKDAGKEKARGKNANSCFYS